MSTLNDIRTRVGIFFKAIKEENEAIDAKFPAAALKLYNAKTDKATNNLYYHAPEDLAYLLGELVTARSVAHSALHELKFQTKHRTCVFCGVDDDYVAHNESCPFHIGKDW